MLYFYNDPQPTKLENLNYRGSSRVPFEFRVYLSTECCVPRESLQTILIIFLNLAEFSSFGILIIFLKAFQNTFRILFQ